MPELTPEEEAFFATGELPESLQPAEPSTPAPVVLPQTQAAPVPDAQAAQPVEDVAALLRQSLAEEQRRYAEAKVRLDALEKQLQEKLAPKLEAPNPETDPLGAMMHQLNTVNANVADLQNKLSQEQQNNLLKQQFEQFAKSVQEMKATYEKTTPDFQDAYQHIRAVRTEDLRSVGVLEADIPKILFQDEINIAQNAIQRGKNPAEEMYAMAKRYGYAPKATTVAPEQKLANIVKGQQAAKQPQRSTPETELTLDSLKDAGDMDLNKMVQNDDLWAKLVGGRSNDIF